MPRSYISDALKLGLTLSGHQDKQLQRFETFLAEEAVAGGGIGPDEVGRMRDRHVLDSLIYATELPVVPKRVLDVGSGVGLPGIPIAIARPELWVTLLDRSQRRTDLAQRACRILGLDAVTLETADVADLTDTWDHLVFRASLPLRQAAEVSKSLLEPGGQTLFGVSRQPTMPEVPPLPPGIRATLTEASRGVLDSPFWLLRMMNHRKLSVG